MKVRPIHVVLDADNADTGGTGTPPCSTTAVTADYTASQGELVVAATATTSSGGRSGLYGTSAPLRAVSVMDSLSNLRPPSYHVG